MKIRFLGQSCFLIHFGGKKLLFDPAISANPIANNELINTLNPDFVLLSHAHGDHSADAEKILKNSSAKLISNYEIVDYYGKLGIEGHPMNIGGKWEFEFGTVKVVNAVHSSVFPDGSYGSNPVGFVIYNQEACFYFAGDTALTMDMKLIPLTCPKLDVAILPIGDNFTMGIDDALIASDFVECQKIIGCHFDSFGFIKIDHEQSKNLFKSKDKELILLEIDEVLEM